MRSCICSCIIPSFIHSFIHAFVRSFIYLPSNRRYGETLSERCLHGILHVRWTQSSFLPRDQHFSHLWRSQPARSIYFRAKFGSLFLFLALWIILGVMWRNFALHKVISSPLKKSNCTNRSVHVKLESLSLYLLFLVMWSNLFFGFILSTLLPIVSSSVVPLGGRLGEWSGNGAENKIWRRGPPRETWPTSEAGHAPLPQEQTSQSAK